MRTRTLLLKRSELITVQAYFSFSCLATIDCGDGGVFTSTITFSSSSKVSHSQMAPWMAAVPSALNVAAEKRHAKIHMVKTNKLLIFKV